jgi:alkylation response protein AidB-like acyl-CoA dehydrogenase
MTVTDYNALSDEEFRQLVLDFVDQECPPELRFGDWKGGWHEVAPWTAKLAERGWLAPAWPVEYGGMGLDASKQITFHEALDLSGAPRTSGNGPQMLGPLVIRYGTDAQKEKFLAPITKGEVLWCQGYSEPNAGSDLASLTTRADLDGDHWVVNGRKIWTTWAHQCDWIFMLVRTGKGDRRQDGITFMVADMKTPGIEPRPIQSLTGAREFCEVVFDDARIPRENVIGEVDKGWGIAKALLGFERLYIGSPKQARDTMIRLVRMARRAGLSADPVFVRDHAQLSLDIFDLEAAYERFRDVVKHGGTLGPEASVLKIWAMETYQRVSDMVLRVAGEEGALLDPVDDGKGEMDILGTHLHSRTATLYAGSNDIQRNVIAKAVLGLPSG